MGYVGNNGTTNTDYEASIADRTTTPDSNHTTQGAFRHGAHQSDPYSDFDQSYDRINSYNQGATAGTYTVRGGETLAAIAQSLYGDSGLWYKLAEANGLSASANLSAGTTLRLPAGVIRNTNSASTVRPHNPGETIGDISPTTPEPPKENKCGVMGQIMLVLVAVVVTAITAGATAGLGGFVSGAIAGATGSIVSQGVGVATGIQDKFSWKSVGISALTAGVSGGAGDVTNFKEFVTAAAKGAAVNAAVQGISVATGLQDKFSWSGVAAAGISAGVGGYAKHRFGAAALSGADKDLSFGNFAANMGVGAARGIANAATRSAIDGTSFGNFAANMGVGAARGIANAATRSAIDGTSFGDNLIASIPDVIGQTFGDALSGAVGGPSDMFSGVNPNTGILGALNSIGGEVSGAIDTVGNIVADNIISVGSGVVDAVGNFGRGSELDGTQVVEVAGPTQLGKKFWERLFGKSPVIESVDYTNIKIRDSNMPGAIFSINGNYVLVDTNRDGVNDENDTFEKFTDDQLYSIGHDFSEFIDNNHTRDISALSADTYRRDLTSNTKNYEELNSQNINDLYWVDVISQFVGAGISDRGWVSSVEPHATIPVFVSPERNTSAAGSTTRIHQKTFGKTSFGYADIDNVLSEETEYKVDIYPDYGSDRTFFRGRVRGEAFRYSATDTARALSHEFEHVLGKARETRTGTPKHIKLDARAGERVFDSGLGGGGYVKIGPYPGRK